MVAADEREHGTGSGMLLQREQELGRIALALEAAREGRGRALLIEGPPGIGKTALVCGTARPAMRWPLPDVPADASSVLAVASGLPTDLLSG